MIHTIVKNIAEIGYVLLFINIIIYSFNKDKDKPHKVLLIYFLTIGVIQILSEIYQNTKGGNLFLTHYYFIVQFILLSSFYYYIIQNNIFRKVIKGFIIFNLISIAIQYCFYPELYYVFNVYEIFICIIPIVIYALVHLFQTLGSSNKKNIYITSGILIYFLPHALVFSSGNLMPDLPEQTNQIIWLVNAILYTLFLILISVEWFKHLRKPIKKTEKQ